MSHSEQEARRALKARRRELDRLRTGHAEISRIDAELRAKPAPVAYAASLFTPYPRTPCYQPVEPPPARLPWGMRRAPKRPRPMRAGWIRLSAPGANTEWGHFLYEPNGADVSHCGHPTANYPYLVVARDGRFVFARNGKAFRLLKDAMDAAELL